MNTGENKPTYRAKTGGKMIQWVDGFPQPVYASPLNKDQLSGLITSALSARYEGIIDPETGEAVGFEERFMGMTNAEVMSIRLAERAAEGDAKATTEILDRVLGKPKQSVESVGVKMNYRDYLDFLADNLDPKERTELKVVDISPAGNDLYDDDEDDDFNPDDVLEGL